MMGWFPDEPPFTKRMNCPHQHICDCTTNCEDGWTMRNEHQQKANCPQCDKPGKRLNVDGGVEWWRCYRCKLDFSTIKLR